VGLAVDTTELEATWLSVAPVKLADVIVAPRNDALVKVALVKSADVTLAFFSDAEVRVAPVKVAPVRTALVRFVLVRVAFVRVAPERFTVFSALSVKFTPVSDAPVRFAPGPMRYPLVSDQPVGRVGAGLVVMEPEIMPVRFAPLKFVLEIVLPVRITPTSEVFEKFTLVNVEFLKLSPFKPLRPWNDIPVKSSPDRFAEGPTRYPVLMNQELGSVGEPVIDPERAPLREDEVRFSEPKLADVNVAPERFTPLVVVDPTVEVRTAPLKFAPVRLAPLSVVPARTVPDRFVVELIFAPVRLAPVSFALVKLAPLKFA